MDKARQAELKREYKEAKRPAGVYQIKNTVTGKIFIGSSVNVQGRINRHKASFALFDKHEIPELAADARKYGVENITFEILETLDGEYESDAALKDDLKLLEQMWLEKCEPYGDRGYNKRV